MIANDTISQMCISARAMGLRKQEWLTVEDHLTTMLKSSGPEYVIQYLKDLKQAKLNQMCGVPFKDDLAWHKVNRKGEPCGWQSVLWNRRRPKTTIKLLGALINAIELEDISSKQYDKWHSAVRESEGAVKGSEKILPKLHFPKWFEKRLAERIAKQHVFQPSDITGTSIPGIYDRILVPGQVTNSDDVATYIAAYILSLESAPRFAGAFEKRTLEILRSNYPDLNIQDEEDRKTLSYESWMNADARGFIDEALVPELVDKRLEAMDHVGQIAFLEQPGGKLRAIGNPNRYVQHLFRPLQETLSDYVNNIPGVYVTNQQAGMQWAQSMLKRGRTLVSMDLSSATDTLDFMFFMRNILDLEEGSLCEDQFETFGLAARSLWYSPDLGTSVNWKCGQVLGLAPSFSYLTMMNTYACLVAQREYELRTGTKVEEPMFAVVGDDAICLAEIAPVYSKVISLLGGNANPEKAMTSNKYAEFCSHIITEKSIWPLKPKIRGSVESFFVDIQKVGYNKMVGARQYPRRFQSMAEYLSVWSSSDLGNLPDIPGSPRPLSDRLSASQYLSIVSQITERLPEDHQIDLGSTLDAVLMKASAEFAKPSLKVNANSPMAVSAYTYLFKNRETVIDNWLADRPVKVSLPARREVWDWRKADYVPRASSISNAKTLARNLKKIENMSDFSDQGLIAGLYDPWQSKKSAYDGSFKLLVDPKDNYFTLYEEIDGKDHFICDSDSQTVIDQTRASSLAQNVVKSRNSFILDTLKGDWETLETNLPVIKDLNKSNSKLKLPREVLSHLRTLSEEGKKLWAMSSDEFCDSQFISMDRDRPDIPHDQLTLLCNASDVVSLALERSERLGDAGSKAATTQKTLETVPTNEKRSNTKPEPQKDRSSKRHTRNSISQQREDNSEGSNLEEVRKSGQMRPDPHEGTEHSDPGSVVLRTKSTLHPIGDSPKEGQGNLASSGDKSEDIPTSKLLEEYEEILASSSFKKVVRKKQDDYDLDF